MTSDAFRLSAESGIFDCFAGLELSRTAEYAYVDTVSSVHSGNMQAGALSQETVMLRGRILATVLFAGFALRKASLLRSLCLKVF